MALTKALQKRIDLANKYIKFAQKHDIFGRGYFGSTMEEVFTYPHLITVSPTGRSVRVRYNDVYGKGKHSQSFNTNDPDSVSDLRYEMTHYVIGAIKRGAKDEGRSIPKTLSNPTKRKNTYRIRAPKKPTYFMGRETGNKPIYIAVLQEKLPGEPWEVLGPPLEYPTTSLESALLKAKRGADTISVYADDIGQYRTAVYKLRKTVRSHGQLSERALRVFRPTRPKSNPTRS